MSAWAALITWPQVWVEGNEVGMQVGLWAFLLRSQETFPQQAGEQRRVWRGTALKNLNSCPALLPLAVWLCISHSPSEPQWLLLQHEITSIWESLWGLNEIPCTEPIHPGLEVGGMWWATSPTSCYYQAIIVGEDSWESLGLQGDPTSPS